MLGTIGLASASVAFGLYAYSSDRLLQHKSVKFASKNSYILAYCFAMLAAFFWTLATLLPSRKIMMALFFGDLMLMGTTLLLLNVLITKNKTILMSLAALTAGALLYFRFIVDTSVAVMNQGILVFNTPRPFGASLLVIFLVVWLTVNKRFYRAVTNKLPVRATLEQIYYSSNILALIGVAGFMFAKKKITITYSFSILILAYVCLVALNFYANMHRSRNS